MDIEAHYRRYGPMVLRRCRALLKNESKAAEAMQETFVKILSAKSLKDQAPSSFLYRVATNVCLNIIRSERLAIFQNSPELSEIARTIDPTSGWLSRNIITQMFSRQKELNAYIAVLFYLDEMTLEEVSQETGLSVSGVRKRLKQIQLRATRYKEI